VQVPALTPKPPLTHYSNPGCYLAFTSNCGTKLSREHWASKSILAQMEGEIQVRNFPGSPEGKMRTVGIQALASKCLCKRHNQALGPLDELAGKLFRDIGNIISHQMKRTLSKRDVWFLHSGEALELWAVKTLCNLYYSGIARDPQGIPLKNEYELARSVPEYLISKVGPGKTHGLYIHARHGNLPRQLELSVYTDELNVIGLGITFHGLKLELFPNVGPMNYAAGLDERIHHPWNIVLKDRRREHIIVLTWPDRPLADQKRILLHVQPGWYKPVKDSTNAAGRSPSAKSMP
jgi:hypothetical protein